ncbi:MAG: CDP-alcohol phosphatidyltransferase family protein [Phycisphaeraceae bacterium]
MSDATQRYEVTERRPMKPREWAIMRAAASALARAGVSPNAVSVASAVCCIMAGLAMAGTAGSEGVTARLLWLAAAALVLMRGVCNLLDGMIAVETGKASAVGELYNDVPDRVSDVAMLVGLGYAAGGAGGTPELGYLAACVALLVAYARVIGKAAGAAHDYAGPMAKPQRMFLVIAAALFFALTPTAWHVPWWGPAGGWGVAQGVLVIIIVAGVWTVGRRLARVARALRGARA